MTDDPGRVPPANPWNITLTYRHDHRWWFDADDAPETWHVCADVWSGLLQDLLDPRGERCEQFGADRDGIVVLSHCQTQPAGMDRELAVGCMGRAGHGQGSTKAGEGWMGRDPRSAGRSRER
jgi:hypothetical protein